MLSFQGVKHLQRQAPTQNIPPGVPCAKQCRGFAVWDKLISPFSHKGVFSVTNERHELLERDNGAAMLMVCAGVA